MGEELTVEQEDELLRADLYADESSINDQEEADVTEAEPEEQEAKQEEPIETPKKKNNVAKILAQRNEYEKEANRYKAEVEEAKKRIAELEGSEDYDQKEYMDALVEKKLAEKLEVQDFFSRNPQANEIKEELEVYRAENPSLSYDRAYRFYLAETNPSALLDEQTQNKLHAPNYSLAGRTPKALTKQKEYTYSESEMDDLIKKGVIKI